VAQARVEGEGDEGAGQGDAAQLEHVDAPVGRQRGAGVEVRPGGEPAGSGQV
jgi:hypothetical protein